MNDSRYHDWMPGDERAIAVYEYTDEQGNVLFGVSRSADKQFSQWRPDAASPTGRRWSLSWTGEDGKKHTVRKVPFDLPKVIKAVADGAMVYVAEGEKDAISLQRIGVCATTNPGGAGKWTKSYAKYLEGASVVVIADRDAPGWAHTRQVITTLDGVAASVRVVCAKEGKDASDHLAAGHGVDDFEPLDMWGVQPDWARSANGGSATAPDDHRQVRHVDVSRDDGAAILDAMEAVWRKYVVWGTDHDPVALALWAMHTHAFGAADCTPYIDVGSAVFESGKTRVLEVAELVVAHGWRLSEPTEATLFRKIEQDAPTLLLDEYDAVWGTKTDGREALRAVFDVGYRRGGTVPRCTGEGLNMTVSNFNVFAPKMLAGIAGRLPRAIATRSIPVRLRRRKKTEPVDRFRDREARALLYPLRDRMAAWAELVADELGDASPELPWALTDRQQDCWEPLLAIADVAGGDWPDRARRAALAIHVTDKDDPSTGELLLRHVADAFIAAQTPYLPTEDLLRTLADRDDGPWADWWEKPLREIPPRVKGPSMRLARLLRPFGIAPRDIAVGAHGSVRGYRMESFYDAWERYGIAITPETPQPPKRSRGPEDADGVGVSVPRTSGTSSELKPSVHKGPTILGTETRAEGGGDGAESSEAERPDTQAVRAWEAGPPTYMPTYAPPASFPHPGANLYACPVCGRDVANGDHSGCRLGGQVEAAQREVVIVPDRRPRRAVTGP
jgi:hypothetical protein